LYNFFGEYNLPYEVAPKGGETIAMEAIEPWHLDQFEVGNFFTKKVGVARCSDEDNYNKKVGRELALSRMKDTVLTVIDFKDYGEMKLAVLEDNKGKQYIVEKRPNFKRVHFVSYE
jgi:hypothetical protein